MTKKTVPFFGFSLLGHLLLFLSFTLVLTYSARAPKIYQAKTEETPGSVVEAYFSPPETSSSSQENNPAQKKIETSPLGIEKPQSAKSSEQIKTAIPKPAQRPTRPQKPHMKMDEKNFNPLLKLLHDATDAQLSYPQLAGDFRVTGTTRIGFTIHPDGKVTQIKMVQSSHFPPFDNAALDAVKGISPVRGVGAYLSESQYVEVNVIFR